MAEEVTVARPYAEAAFQLAKQQDALPVWSEMLRYAATVSTESRVRLALDNPKLGGPQKEALLLSLCGDKLDNNGRNFIRVLTEADRIGLLPQIRELFELLKDEAEGVARASITSAFPMTDEQVNRIKAALERRFGKRIEPTVTVDEALIGGARIAVGDTVIDGSVRAELESMANQLRI
jgi:F-type H+-transporting ATPase subunit delta